MRKIVPYLMLVVLLSLVFLTACNDKVAGVAEDRNRFVAVTGYDYYFGNSDYRVYEDSVTGVLYLAYGSYGGLSPFYKDTNGTLMTRKDLKEQEAERLGR